MTNKKDYDLAEKWWKEQEKKRERREFLYRYGYGGIKFKVKDPILEIGGGNGRFLDFIKIKKADIVDIAGKETLVSKQYKFIEGDITKKLPKLPHKTYNTIFIMETLEHIKNPLYLMAQVYDLLSNKGFCYISVPYTKLDVERKHHENPFDAHVCRWNLKELTRQMELLGFNVTVVKKLKRKIHKPFPWKPHKWLVFELTKRLKH